MQSKKVFQSLKNIHQSLFVKRFICHQSPLSWSGQKQSIECQAYKCLLSMSDESFMKWPMVNLFFPGSTLEDKFHLIFKVCLLKLTWYIISLKYSFLGYWDSNEENWPWISLSELVTAGNLVSDSNVSKRIGFFREDKKARIFGLGFVKHYFLCNVDFKLPNSHYFQYERNCFNCLLSLFKHILNFYISNMHSSFKKKKNKKNCTRYFITVLYCDYCTR